MGKVDADVKLSVFTGGSSRPPVSRLVRDRSRSNPDLLPLVEAARERRRMLRELAAARREAGLTQTAVAARMGTSEAAVSRLESGEADPKVSTVERYAAALGKRVEWRIAGDSPAA